MKYGSLGLLLVGSAFLGYWTLLVYCEVWRPNPVGARLSTRPDGGVLVDGLVSGGPADRAGLRAGDRISAVDGHAIRGRLGWIAVGANLEFDRPVRFSVDRAGARREVIIAPERASWQSWRSQRGPELLVIRTTQLVTLLLALLVAVKRRGDTTALVGAAFLAAIGVFSVTLPYRFATVWRGLPLLVSALLWLPFVSSVAVAAWAFSFFAIFPRVRFRAPLAWCAVWIPIVPGLVGQAAYGYYTIVLGDPAAALPPWAEGLMAVSAAYLVATFTILVLNYRRLTDVNERRRVRVVMIGLVIGAAGGLPVVWKYWQSSTNNLDHLLLGSPLDTVGIFLLLAVPLSFAYAILRHRLFDVSLMIRQGLRYGLARRALLAIVPALLVLLGVDLVAHGDEAVSDVVRSRAWIYVLVVGLVIAARTRRQAWLDGLDRRFFRERYNAQKLLRQVAEDVRQASNLADVAPTVVSRIDEALHPAFAALLVHRSDGRWFQSVAASPAGRPPVRLDAANKVLAMARLVRAPLEITEAATGWLARKMPVEDLRSIQEAGVALIVPIASDGRDSSAVIALGPKRSEEPYTDDDGELLMAIAESVALRLATIEEIPVPAVDRFEECPTCGACYDPGTHRCYEDDAPLAPVNAPRLLADRYQLERRLGRGGMGTVYAAIDTSLNRRVATKLMREDLIGLAGAAERFQREARVAAAFSHPNVVTVYDFGISGPRAFLVMELLDGRTLRETLQSEGRIDSERAVAVLRDVTSAVEAAHRRQLIHRDLKPENICLVSHDSGESAKVLDFGLARFFAPADGHPLGTQATGGAVLGTPWYMAPEQLRGEDPDPSWDLWALAVVAFEMLTGSHPFASMTLSAAGRPDPPASDRRFANLPDSCAAFFARALALDRAARPRSPALFLTELERSLHA